MLSKVICPDCGGTVGELTSATDTPCNCLKKLAADYSADDYKAAATAAAIEAEAAAAATGKVCRVCGKDLTGQKRLKDSKGYWCVDCHRADELKKSATEARCSECTRIFPRAKLSESPVDGTLFCYNCERARRARQRELLKKAAGGRIHKLYERRQILIMAGVLLVLILIILLQRSGVL